MKKSIITSAILASLTLSACGGSSGSSDDDVVTPQPPANTAPTDISLDVMSVDENTAGATIGTLSATDAEGGAMTFTVDSDMFAVDGDQLSLAAEYSANYEDASSLTVNVTVADADGATFSKELTIDVNDLLDTYSFASKFEDGASSVSYTGQIARHVLIAELNNFISNLETWLDANNSATKDDVLAELNKRYFVGEDIYPDVEGNDALTAEHEQLRQDMYDSLAITFADAEQTMVADISSSYKNIHEKIAGNDASGQDIDWLDGNFAGWANKGDYTPESLVLEWFDMLADQAVAYNAGTEMDSVYVTAEGLDLKQLIQKHLLMSVAFSQSAGDYLGNDYEGKGLTTDNISAVSGKAYSNLEHQFDEGFGYFGAPVNYLEYTDEEIAIKGGRDEFQGKNDFDGNGTINLVSEYVFGASSNAAKRDRGATVATDMTSDIMNAFLEGRKIINDAAGMALTDEEMTALQAQRDIAILGWEKAIAATVVHYINDSVADLNNVGTADFSLTDLAKHWSEMKGFGLGLQFSPFSPFYDAANAGKFEEVHTLFKDAPVFDESAPADVTDYIADLLAARDILQQVYGFDAENVANW